MGPSITWSVGSLAGPLLLLLEFIVEREVRTRCTNAEVGGLDPTASQKPERRKPELRRSHPFSIAWATTPQHTISSHQPTVDLLNPPTLAQALKCEQVLYKVVVAGQEVKTFFHRR